MPSSAVRLSAIIEPQDVGRVVRLDVFGCDARLIVAGTGYYAQTRALLASGQPNDEDWSTVEDPAPGFFDALAEALDAILGVV